MEMKQAEQNRRLQDSKYGLKKLTVKKKAEMGRESGLEVEMEAGEDKEIWDKKENRKQTFRILHKGRKTLGVIKAIVQNTVVVEEFKAILSIKRQWKTAKDANLIESLILTAVDIIKRQNWKSGNM